MKRLFAIALVVVACSGGGGAAAIPDPTERPTPKPAWPDGWSSDFCYGLDQLSDAGGHMSAAAEAGQNFDYDGAIEEAEQAATDAGEAFDAFGYADNWAPAHSAIVYLSSASDHAVKAANLFVLGIESIEPSLIEESNAYTEKSTYQLGRAQTSLEALRDKYGAFC